MQGKIQLECLLKLVVRIVSTMKHNKQISDKWLFCSEVLLKLKSGRHTLMVCLGYYIGKNLTSKNTRPQRLKSSLSLLIRRMCVIYSSLPCLSLFICGPTVKGTIYDLDVNRNWINKVTLIVASSKWGVQCHRAPLPLSCDLSRLPGAVSS